MTPAPSAAAKPAVRSAVTPVTAWAALGAAFLAVEAYVAARYIAHGGIYVSTAPISSLTRTQRMLVWAAQILVIAMVMPLVAWIASACLRQRKVTVDLMLLAGFMSQSVLDPYFSPMGMLDAASVHIPSWGQFLPLWKRLFWPAGPSGKVEPLLVTGVGYLTGMVFCLTAALIMATVVLRRWPRLAGWRLVLAGLGVCAAIGVPVETVWIRTGAYAYRKGVPWLTLFSGHWYQVPVYLPVTSGVFWYGIACIVRHYYLTSGSESTIYKGTSTLPARWRTMAQLLATIGLLDLCVILDTASFRLFMLLPGTAAAHLPLPFV